MALTKKINTWNSYDELPLKFQKAVDTYLNTQNQTEAIRQVFTAKELEKKSTPDLCYTGSMFFNKSNIKAICRERHDELLRQSSMTSQDIIALYEAIAKGEVQDQFSEITAVKDRKSALDSLAKIHGILDNSNININNNMAVQFVNDL